MKVGLIWDSANLPHEAWGYYDSPVDNVYGTVTVMYCKVYRGTGTYYLMRSLMNNSGYDFPIRLEGATTMEEAKQLAHVHFFMDEGRPPRTRAEFQRELTERDQKEREDERRRRS